MSDEFDPVPETHYSPFWPLLILVVGLFIWSGYQVYAANSQRNVYTRQVQSALPAIGEAQTISNRYVALMQDLVATSQKDPAAADIVKAAIQAGLIHVKPKDTNGVTNPAAPAPDAAPSK